MKAWAIQWSGYGECYVDKQKIFLNEEDAKTCLKAIEKGKTYDYLPKIVTLEINEYYDENIWIDKWGFSGKRKNNDKT